MERGICPTAESIMSDTAIWCRCHNCLPTYSRQDCFWTYCWSKPQNLFTIVLLDPGSL